MEVLLADAGRAAAVVITDGVLAGKSVPGAAAGVEGSRGVGAAAVDAGEGALMRFWPRAHHSRAIRDVWRW